MMRRQRIVQSFLRRKKEPRNSQLILTQTQNSELTDKFEQNFIESSENPEKSCFSEQNQDQNNCLSQSSHQHTFMRRSSNAFASVFLGRRRNAMSQTSHRRSFVKGILQVAAGEDSLPASELEENKRLPHYVLRVEPYSWPDRYNRPLPDPDRYYQNEVSTFLIRLVKFIFKKFLSLR